MAAARDTAQRARRIVIKVGTRVATEGDNAFSADVVGSLVRQVAALGGDASRRSFIIVSSGAIALGLNRMGQSRLMRAWEREFEAARRETTQILLTAEDIRSRARYFNRTRGTRRTSRMRATWRRRCGCTW